MGHPDYPVNPIWAAEETAPKGISETAKSNAHPPLPVTQGPISPGSKANLPVSLAAHPAVPTTMAEFGDNASPLPDDAESTQKRVLATRQRQAAAAPAAAAAASPGVTSFLTPAVATAALSGYEWFESHLESKFRGVPLRHRPLHNKAQGNPQPEEDEAPTAHPQVEP